MIHDNISLRHQEETVEPRLKCATKMLKEMFLDVEVYLSQISFPNSNTINTIYYEKVNSAYAEAAIAILVIFLYLRYKLKYWSWLGVPNEVSSVYNRFLRPFHEADQISYKKYGRVVG